MKLPIQAPAVPRSGISWRPYAQGLVQGVVPQDQAVKCGNVQCTASQVCCPADPAHNNSPFCNQCPSGQMCCGPDASHMNSYCATTCS